MKKNKTKLDKFISDQYERAAWLKNSLVCGIDEAGRGCFAGPVVVAAAVLKPGSVHPLLKDSKILTQQQRNQAFFWIQENAWFVVCVGTVEEIENENILQTTKKKMVQAFINLVEQEKFLQKTVGTLLIDAVPLIIPSDYLPHDLKIESFPFGESRSISIAAASIVAKVTRDSILQELHKLFPVYGFDEHMGYGTAKHCKVLMEKGSSIVHRLSFLKKLHAARQCVEQQSVIGVM